MKLKSGTLVNGRYRIENQIGIGGTAVVYKATDEKLGRVVTLKTLREEYVDNKEFIKRFTTEAQAAARLNHPNIVSAYDVGRDGDICYIIMEYIDGYTLKELIRKNAPFTNEETLGVSLQIAAALEAAHNNNIVHRDIKPQNILVTKEGNIKVTDFGIARAASSSTLTTEQMGSAHYFSPEQARGGFVDNKSDIYSLGIVMFEMLAGKVPFDGDSPVALAIKHMDQPIPDIKAINPNASDSLVKIINKATAKRSANRYQSAEELIEDLRMAVNDPDGEFVKDNQPDRTSHTIVITSEDRKVIREKSRNFDRPSEPPRRPKSSSEDYRRERMAERERARAKRESAESRKFIIGGVLTGVAIVVVITVIVAFLIGGASSNDVVMPKLVDLTQELAEKAAKENGIFLDIESVQSDALKGVVVGQEIEEGEKISRGDTVKIQVSMGNGEVELPDVVGSTMDEAQKTLKEAGITNVNFSLQQSPNIPSGTVISTKPDAGTMINADDEVVLFVSISDKEETIEVEDVLGKSESEAVKILEEQGFVVKTDKVASDEYPEGQVCAQSKDGGFEALKGSSIMIYVSTGPKEVKVEAEEQTQPSAPDHDVQNIDFNDAVGGKSTVSVPITQVPDKDKVNVKITEVGLDGTETVVYQKEISKSSFPYSFTLEGSGGTYNVYYDDKISAVHNFEDGALASSNYYEDGKLTGSDNY